MGVRESLLNTITSVADSDFVRIVTSAGASSKATVRNLFKGFESNLGAKSSLTTSDYLRVVGSDNEAYKQSLDDVADKVLSAYPKMNPTADVLAWAEERNGIGIISTNNNTANLPSVSNKYGVAWVNNKVVGTALYANLFWSPTNTTEIYVCQKTNTAAWSAWEKLPTRAEVDALADKIQRYASNVTTGNTCTFNLVNTATNAYHYGLLIGGSSTTNPYVAFVFLGGSSGGVRTVGVTPILSNAITITGTANDSTVTFTVTSGNAYGGLRYIDLS